jgi:AraC family transcriptional regulator
MFSFVKAETQSFYEAAVRKAVAHLVTHLDDALELGALARTAALSPFHFHRVFRGMLGETPVAMHRRLRLERAAYRLLQGDGPITRVAFDSGYNTHESFTHAFRAQYGLAPSEFRGSTPGRDSACVRPHQFQLAAQNGIHFQASTEVTARNAIDPAIVFITATGGDPMDVSIKAMPAFRLAAIRHVGPYQHISGAFQRLGAIAGPAGLLGNPETAMIGVYYDDPESTPLEQLRSDAAVSVPEDRGLPAELSEVRLPAGRYASTTHIGPYETLGDTWARFMGGWLPSSGYRIADGGLSYELYRNTPLTAAPEELRTELYLPLSS